MMDALLIHRATLYPYLRQGSGGPLYGAPEERQCRMEPGFRDKVVYKDASGIIHETVSGMLMFCRGDPIPVLSRVIWEGLEMRVVRCREMMGMGRHHLEVDLE